MPRKKSTKPYTHYHRNSSLWVKGHMGGDTMESYWEWFRKDGTKMRSGYFDNGKQIGTWITYDKKGRIVKTTEMKTK